MAIVQCQLALEIEAMPRSSLALQCRPWQVEGTQIKRCFFAASDPKPKRKRFTPALFRSCFLPCEVQIHARKRFDCPTSRLRLMMLGVLESAREVEVKEAESTRKLTFIFHFHNCRECFVSCRYAHPRKQCHHSMTGLGEVVNGGPRKCLSTSF